MKPDQSDSSKLNALRETIFDSPAVALVGLLVLLLLLWFFWLEPGAGKKPAATTAAAPVPPASAGAAAYLIASAVPVAASAAPAATATTAAVSDGGAIAVAGSGSHTVVLLSSKPSFMSDADWARLQSTAATASANQQSPQLKSIIDLQQKINTWQTQPAMREQLSQQILQKLPELVANGVVSPDQAQQMQQAILNAPGVGGNPPPGYGNGGGFGGGGPDSLQSPLPSNNGMNQ
jgi:hypothetical protein